MPAGPSDSRRTDQIPRAAIYAPRDGFCQMSTTLLLRATWAEIDCRHKLSCRRIISKVFSRAFDCGLFSFDFSSLARTFYITIIIVIIIIIMFKMNSEYRTWTHIGVQMCNTLHAYSGLGGCICFFTDISRAPGANWKRVKPSLATCNIMIGIILF